MTNNHQVEKTIFTPEFRELLVLLKEIRQKNGVTQFDLAEALGTTQSVISKYERGERRIDLIQLRDFCNAIGTTLPKFVREFERRIGN